MSEFWLCNTYIQKEAQLFSKSKYLVSFLLSIVFAFLFSYCPHVDNKMLIIHTISEFWGGEFDFNCVGVHFFLLVVYYYWGCSRVWVNCVQQQKENKDRGIRQSTVNKISCQRNSPTTQLTCERASELVELV